MIRQVVPYLLLVTAADIPPNMKALITQSVKQATPNGLIYRRHVRL